MNLKSLFSNLSNQSKLNIYHGAILIGGYFVLKISNLSLPLWLYWLPVSALLIMVSLVIEYVICVQYIYAYRRYKKIVGYIDWTFFVGDQLYYLLTIAIFLTSRYSNTNSELIHGLGNYFLLSIILVVNLWLDEWLSNFYNRDNQAVMNLVPPTARVVVNDDEHIIPIIHLNPGNVVLVTAHELIPVDGKIISGQAIVESEFLTGDKIKRDCYAGDVVLAGSRVLSGKIFIKVSSLSSKFRVKELTRIYQNSIRNHIKYFGEKDNKFIRWFFYCFVLILLSVGLVSNIQHRQTIYNQVLFLVSLLIIFRPYLHKRSWQSVITYFLTSLVNHGVVLQTLKLLEGFHHLNKVALSKTGIVVSNKVKLVEIAASQPDLVLKIAASLQHGVTNPISKAILSSFKQEKSELHQVSERLYIEGKGVVGVINKEKYVLGNLSLMHRYDIAIGVLLREKNRLENMGYTVIVLAKPGKLALGSSHQLQPGEVLGLMAFENQIQPTVLKTIKELISSKLSVSLVTGDSLVTSKYFAEKIGISSDNIYAEVNQGQLDEVYSEIANIEDGSVLTVGQNIVSSKTSSKIIQTQITTIYKTLSNNCDINVFTGGLETMPGLLKSIKMFDSLYFQLLVGFIICEIVVVILILSFKPEIYFAGVISLMVYAIYHVMLKLLITKTVHMLNK